MSSLTRTVPKNARELSDYLNKIHDNRRHVKGVTVNLTTAHLELLLDMPAHVAGDSDVYLPLKRTKVTDAKALLERLLREWEQGFGSSEANALELFDMIDPTGQ